MYDVTEDVIHYLNAESRNEDELQKIWEELVSWKTKRDKDMKAAAAEEKKRKEREAQVKIVENERYKLAVATAAYMTALFKLHNRDIDYDDVVQETVDHMKKAEEAMDFAEQLKEKLGNFKPDEVDKTLTQNKSDDKKLEDYLRKAGLI